MEQFQTDVIDAVVDMINAARAETLPRFRKLSQVTNKDKKDFDPVTEADQAAEAAIRKVIEARFPEHGILGEEFGRKETGSPWRWVLDPIDGTRGFICGQPSWTTLISLEYEKFPMIGVIDQPYIGECYFGGDLQGRSTSRVLYGEISKTSGRPYPIRVSGEKKLKQARVTTTDPFDNGYFTEDEAICYRDLASKTQVARYSQDAYGYALLARGQMDLVVEAGLNRYDLSALVPIVKQAGGVITDWRGNDFDANWQGIGDADGARGQIIAAASREILEQALPFLSRGAV